MASIDGVAVEGRSLRLSIDTKILGWLIFAALIGAGITGNAFLIIVMFLALVWFLNSSAYTDRDDEDDTHERIKSQFTVSCPECDGTGSRLDVLNVETEDGGFVDTPHGIVCPNCDGIGVIAKGESTQPDADDDKGGLQTRQPRRNRIPYAEIDLLGSAWCAHCRKPIETGELRVVLGREIEYGSRYRTNPIRLHPSCAFAEIQEEDCSTKADGFEAAIRANSPGLTKEQIDSVLLVKDNEAQSDRIVEDDSAFNYEDHGGLGDPPGFAHGNLEDTDPGVPVSLVDDIEFPCPNCQTRLRIEKSDWRPGVRVRCPNCSNVISS